MPVDTHPALDYKLDQQILRSVTDINALVQKALRDSYVQGAKELSTCAAKVAFFDQLKKSIRAELTAARGHRAQSAGKDDAAPIKPWVGKNISRDLACQQTATMKPTLQRGKTISTRGELSAYILDVEEALNSIGDAAQLANVDLQDALQKQQQTLQMMSNISKMLNDTALEVIRKIGS